MEHFAGTANDSALQLNSKKAKVGGKSLMCHVMTGFLNLRAEITNLL